MLTIPLFFYWPLLAPRPAAPWEAFTHRIADQAAGSLNYVDPLFGQALGPFANPRNRRSGSILYTLAEKMHLPCEVFIIMGTLLRHIGKAAENRAAKNRIAKVRPVKKRIAKRQVVENAIVFMASPLSRFRTSLTPGRRHADRGLLFY